MGTPNARELQFKVLHESQCGCNLVFWPGRYMVRNGNSGPLRTYIPDFFCERTQMFYEVSGSRQAYHFNKWKYKSFAERYKQYKFKVVRCDGTEYIDRRKARDIVSQKHQNIWHAKAITKCNDREYRLSIKSRLRAVSSNDWGYLTRMAKELVIPPSAPAAWVTKRLFSKKTAQKIEAYINANPSLGRTRLDACRNNGAHNARKNLCKYGHPFNENNTYVIRRSRICRICASIRAKRYYTAKRGKGL
jgi:hypothetical protein